MAQKMDLWHCRPALAISRLADYHWPGYCSFLVAKTTSMPNFSLLIHPHGLGDGPVARRAGHVPGHVWAGHVWAGLIIGIHVAKTTCMPNFSLLSLPMAQKIDLWHSGPALAMSGLALTYLGPNHIWPRHWFSSDQYHLMAKFQPSNSSPWPGRWTCGTLGWP